MEQIDAETRSAKEKTPRAHVIKIFWQCLASQKKKQKQKQQQIEKKQMKQCSILAATDNAWEEATAAAAAAVHLTWTSQKHVSSATAFILRTGWYIILYWMYTQKRVRYNLCSLMSVPIWSMCSILFYIGIYLSGMHIWKQFLKQSHCHRPSQILCVNSEIFPASVFCKSGWNRTFWLITALFLIWKHKMVLYSCSGLPSVKECKAA